LNTDDCISSESDPLILNRHWWRADFKSGWNPESDDGQLSLGKAEERCNMAGTIRAFIAYQLPGPVIAFLANLQRQIKATDIQVRWVQPENIHLTLKFLGTIQAVDIDDIVRCMSDSIQGLAPFTLTAKGIGVFPGIKRPRVIWVGLAGQIQLLVALQGKLEDSLAATGFPRENKAFRGHLTLGRVKAAVNPGVISQIIQEYEGLHSDEFKVNAIDLFQSTLHPTGSVYTKLQRVAF
jgi:2'-5' RNA ligase